MTLLLPGTATAASSARLPSEETALARSAGAGPVRVWVLAMVLAGWAGWLVVVGFLDLLHAHDLPHAVLAAQEQMIAPALIGVVVVVFLVERLWPAVPAGAAGPGSSGGCGLPRVVRAGGAVHHLVEHRVSRSWSRVTPIS